MFEISSPVLEIVLRAVLVYVGLWAIFRVTGKRQLGEMSPFDLILLLIISESVSSSLNAEEKSVPGGLISALTLVVIAYVVDYATFRSRRFEKFMESSPQVIIENGKINEKVRHSEKFTVDEIAEAIRQKGYRRIEDVRLAILETNGQISTIDS